MKNIVTIILIILLVIVVGMAAYLYMNSQKQNTEIQTLKAEIQTLRNENELLKEKTTKALSYAEYTDVLIFPFLKDMGVTPRFNFTNEMLWMFDLEKRSSSFNDSELNGYIERMRSQDQKAFGLILNWALEKIEEALK
ncbi:MAG: hypothetical protein ACPLW9_02685 [Minisyncoccales bacterium]